MGEKRGKNRRKRKGRKSIRGKDKEEKKGEFKTLRVSPGDDEQEKTVIFTRINHTVRGDRQTISGEIVSGLFSY